MEITITYGPCCHGDKKEHTCARVCVCMYVCVIIMYVCVHSYTAHNWLYIRLQVALGLLVFPRTNMCAWPTMQVYSHPVHTYLSTPHITILLGLHITIYVCAHCITLVAPFAGVTLLVHWPCFISQMCGFFSSWGINRECSVIMW